MFAKMLGDSNVWTRAGSQLWATAWQFIRSNLGRLATLGDGITAFMGFPIWAFILHCLIGSFFGLFDFGDLPIELHSLGYSTWVELFVCQQLPPNMAELIPIINFCHIHFVFPSNIWNSQEFQSLFSSIAWKGAMFANPYNPQIRHFIAPLNHASFFRASLSQYYCSSPCFSAT